MKLPRDVSGSDLAKALRRLGYQVTRQTGSHLRLTTTERGEHHVTIPNHNPLKIGTLSESSAMSPRTASLAVTS
jgi:predicted RNA binding protein YcfA (HicA-like mRNA interferase family)